MKTKLIAALSLLLSCSFIGMKAQDATTIMAISDPHVMITSLFDNQADFTSDPKLVEHSQELFEDALEIIQEAAPDMLLIPGDLTKDGEAANHNYVAGKLAELQEVGIQVFVVPGNHDIANPSAQSYLGGGHQSVSSVTATEFATIYANMGYGNAALLSADGLSYLTWANDTLAILGLNSTQPNTTSRASSGGLTAETLDFVDQAMDSVRARGGQVIAMMHHQLVEHFDGEATVAANYVCNTDQDLYTISRDSVHHRLMLAGVSVVLTGHFHIHSIQHVAPDTRGWDPELPTLTDISTGALCSLPTPIRTLYLTGEELEIETDNIDTYEAEAMIRNGNTVRGGINTLAPMIVEKLPQLMNKAGITQASLDQMNLPTAASLHAYFDVPGLKLLNTLAYGDEELNNPKAIERELQDSLNHFLNYTIPQYEQGVTAMLDAYGAGQAALIEAFIILIKKLFPQMVEPVLYNYVTTSGSLLGQLANINQNENATPSDFSNIGTSEIVRDTVDDWFFSTILPVIERQEMPTGFESISDAIRPQGTRDVFVRQGHIYVRKQEKTYSLKGEEIR